MNEATTVLLGTRVHGHVRGVRDLLVEGRLEGDVTIDGDLLVTETGVVRGTVRARNVRVFGVVVGSITATERVQASFGSRIAGDLSSPAIEVEPGSVFRGEAREQPLVVGVATEPRGVLSQASPGRARPIPRRPPSSIMPMVGRSQGRMRAYG